MTAKSRARKFAQKKVKQPHSIIYKDEVGDIILFRKEPCTCSENKHHFAKEND